MSPQHDRDRRPLPSVFYNTVTLIGATLAAGSLGLIIFLIILEALTGEQKPYMGIIAFVILPIFLILGLIILIIGSLREHRRRRRGLGPSRRLPYIDLNNSQHRRAFVVFAGGSVLLLLLSGFGSFKAYEYTDSDEFCGEICHEVMHPEFTAYQVSPHARVGCVKCHIGPGAGWFVRSKLSGAYQVYATVFNKYPKPIHTPIKSLRPSRETCEQCHWPRHFYEENFVAYDYYLQDEENSRWRLDILMKIGGGAHEFGPSSGIHWHMNIKNKVEYVALDKERTEIPWMRVTGPDGKQVIYHSTELDFTDEDLEDAEIRIMDCIDCHNRPSHIYYAPYKLVNQALSLGRIDATLPYAKSVAMEALEGSYESTDEALEEIAATVTSFYEEDYPDLVESRGDDIEQFVEELQRLYKQNYFPDMSVSWKAFPNNIGHLTSPGCFRCHDGYHEREDGEILSRDCNTCHTILAQEIVAGDERIALGGVEYKHPEDIGEAWKEMNCSECHGE